MTKMTAKFPGSCKVCGNPIERGQEILWSREHGAIHPDCLPRLQSQLEERRELRTRIAALAQQEAERLADQLHEQGVQVILVMTRGIVEVPREKLVNHVAELLCKKAEELGVDPVSAVQLAARAASEQLARVNETQLHVAELAEYIV